jgi:2-oxoisovalerate dehydrogenase E1 component
MPSNAEDAVGLLRTSLRGQDPVIFFEHRHQYDSPWARRPYPGDSYLLPFGKASIVKQGSKLTLITWGAMVERALEVPFDIEVIDLRTLSPWDKECVINSVKRTRRALVFHEDGITCGFGAEIASTIAKECFMYLDAPVDRIAVKDIPIPYNMELMDHVVPNVEEVSNKVLEIINY